MSIFDCCCQDKKYVIYINGSDEDKELFLNKVFGLKLKDISFSEYKVTVDGAIIYLQALRNQKEMISVHDMHTNMANGVIFLQNHDQKVDSNKKALVIFMNGKTRLENEGNMIVSSVVNQNFEDAKKGVNALVKMIKQ
jgi:hypothetical protein